MIRTYTELCKLESFLDRFRYLSLRGRIGDTTFGFERFLNQDFYTSSEWRHIRHVVIVRDNGLDLGATDREISGRLIIHHMNPLTIEQVQQGDPAMFDPEYLITTSHLTHNAIHYGDERQLPKPLVERTSGDTKLW